MESFNLLGWSSLIGSVHLLAISLLFEEMLLYEYISNKAIYSLLFTIIFPTFIGFGFWGYLLKKYPISLVTPFYLLMPFFGTVTTILLLKEAITLSIVIGGIVTILGVATILVEPKKFRKKKNL